MSYLGHYKKSLLILGLKGRKGVLPRPQREAEITIFLQTGEIRTRKGKSKNVKKKKKRQNSLQIKKFFF